MTKVNHRSIHWIYTVRQCVYVYGVVVFITLYRKVCKFKIQCIAQVFFHMRELKNISLSKLKLFSLVWWNKYSKCRNTRFNLQLACFVWNELIFLLVLFLTNRYLWNDLILSKMAMFFPQKVWMFPEQAMTKLLELLFLAVNNVWNGCSAMMERFSIDFGTLSELFSNISHILFNNLHLNKY